MHISPVSFRSLMCFTLDDKKPKEAVPNFLKVGVKNNPQLSPYGYNVVEKQSPFKQPIDVTVYNANAKICSDLDQIYKKELPSGSRDIFLTKVSVSTNPYDTADRFFLTAATREDENRILNSTLSSGNDFMIAKFGEKSC